jgi:hypothetical protein
MSTPILPSVEHTPAPTPTFSSSISIESRRRDERRIRGVTWYRQPHGPHTYRNGRSSYIWDHGDIYIKAPPAVHPIRSWICDYCDAVCKMDSVGNSTGNQRRHLRDQHAVLDPTISGVREEESEERGVSVSVSASTSAISMSARSTPAISDRESSSFRALTTSINIDLFRVLLLHLFIYCQLSYSLVEHNEFRALLTYLNPSIVRYLPQDHKTIGTWALNEHRQGQLAMKTILKGALSKIHISFDVWTSPSGTPILGICGHFLNSSLQLCHPLLALKYLEGSHTGEVMAKAIRETMNLFEIEDKWGVAVADNAENNDTCVKALIDLVCPGESVYAKRSRCFSHVVNLAAQAFIYGKPREGFIVMAERVVTVSERDQEAVEAEMAHWRQRGAFGKLHNIVKWVNASNQRIERFQRQIQLVLNNRQQGQVDTTASIGKLIFSYFTVLI